MHLYGIPNCATVKKARVWLEERGTPYTFHDFKKEAPSPVLLRSWLAELGRERLINRQGTTWRQLDEQSKAAIVDDASAIALMQAKPSVIKRPLLVTPNALVLGFDATRYQEIFA